MRFDKLSVFKELCRVRSGEPDRTTAIHDDKFGETFIANIRMSWVYQQVFEKRRRWKMGGCLHVTEREEGEEHPGLVDQARIDTLSIGDGCRKHVFSGKHYSLRITYHHDIRQYLLLS